MVLQSKQPQTKKVNFATHLSHQDPMNLAAQNQGKQPYLSKLINTGLFRNDTYSGNNNTKKPITELGEISIYTICFSYNLK